VFSYLQELNSNSFILAIVFLLPGFVILKSKDLIFPSSDKDFSKRSIEIFLYSCLHFLLVFYPVYYWIFKIDKLSNIQTYLLLIFIEIIIPLLYPIAFKFILEFNFLRNKIVFPIERPWEAFFSRREPVWVVIYLKEGGIVIGSFGEKSFVSSSLGNEQIYLEKLCKFDENLELVPILNSKGGIFSKDCWEYIEFLEDMPSSKEVQNGYLSKKGN
jgi:hypothetical protein